VPQIIKTLQVQVPGLGITVDWTPSHIDAEPIQSARLADRRTRKNLYAALVDSLDFPTLEDYGFERAVAADRITRKPRNPRSLILSV
jgi:hypothetical protein